MPFYKLYWRKTGEEELFLLATEATHSEYTEKQLEIKNRLFNRDHSGKELVIRKQLTLQDLIDLKGGI